MLRRPVYAAQCRLVVALCAAVCLAWTLPAPAATKTIDLDQSAANGAESKCELNVLASFPVNVENVVTNRADGSAFDFAWPSAGPGGFTSSVTPGTAGGVGAKWTWTTVQTVYSYTGSSCANDICFLETSGPVSRVSTCSLACLEDGVAVRVNKGATPGEVVLSWSGGSGGYTVYRSAVPVAAADPANALTTTELQQYSDVGADGRASYYLVRAATCLTPKPCTSNADCEPRSEGTCVTRGPFSVPGRSLTPSNVTVSSASLSSSLITFFSPPTEVFRITSTAQPGGVQETLTNPSTEPVTIVTEAYPPGCCPANPDVPHQLRCGDDCLDYLNDPQNCGACDNACDEGTCCSNGNCASLCGEGRVHCAGWCVDLLNDNENCGGCGVGCSEGTCCSGGACVSFCEADDAVCDGRCADLLNDSGHCGSCEAQCIRGTHCSEGVCVTDCDPGERSCYGECFDLQTNREHCGACGVVCPEELFCTEGTCVSECPSGRTFCDGFCYDLMNDRAHCGACDVICPPDESCIQGGCVPALGAIAGMGAGDPNESTPSASPNLSPTRPHTADRRAPNPSRGLGDRFCPNPTPSEPVAAVCPSPGPPAPTVPEAPICEVEATTTTIPPAGSTTVCQPGALLYKEVAAAVSVCGDGIPGPDGQCADGISSVSTGTFMRLVPDHDQTVGDAYLTPYAVHVISDTSNDGMIGPGETASLIIDVLNAGPLDITDAAATLVALPIDLTDNGVADPVGIDVVDGTAAYGTILGTQPSADCEPLTLHPASHSVPFRISVPINHPGDTSHPITLQFGGTVGGSPFSMDVPLTVGIADGCDPEAGTGDFDGVDGLGPPMARLVPVGDPAPFPSRAFTRGQTVPLKVRVLCGGVSLRGGEVDAPEVVGLAEATLGAIDFRALELNGDTDSDDPYFRWSEGSVQWHFNMRTSQLAPGTYTLTIRIAGRKDYVTGFVLLSSPYVEEGAPDWTMGAGVRYKGWNTGKEIYLGPMTSDSATPRVEVEYSDFRTVGQKTYQVTFGFDRDANKITASIVSPDAILEFDFDDSGAPGCAAWDLMVIQIRDSRTDAGAALENVRLNAFDLGDLGTVDKTGTPHARYWTVRGFDFSGSFTVTADLVVDGFYGNESIKVEFGVGCSD